MWKKGFALFLAAALLAGGIPAALAAPQEDGVVQFVSQLGIMTGYPDGSFGLDNSVSRAEFTTIAVKASSYRNAVATNLRISPFYDVSYQYWAAPYIQLASENQLVTGYVDSTFRPENTVTLEEAVTVLLKILGYTNEDFGSSWPYGQVGLANSLKLTENVYKGVGDTLTRRDVAYMIYNLMDTKSKGSNDKYIKTFDCEIIEDVILIATINEDPSVGAGKVVTSSGTYKTGNGFSAGDVGKKGDLVVKDQEEVLYFSPHTQNVQSYTVTSVMGSDILVDGKSLDMDENITVYYKSEKTTYGNLASIADEGMTLRVFANENNVIDYGVLTGQPNSQINLNDLTKYTVYSVLDGAVIVYDNGALEQVDIPDSTTAYKEDQKTTFGAVRTSLEMGDVLSIKWDVNGKIKYINVEEGNMVGPVTVRSANWQESLGIDAAQVSFTRDGVKVDAGSIQMYDVVYYVKDLNMVLAYSKKVTGIYEKATPNRDLPSTITVSGTEYGIESVTAFDKLSSNGSFVYGDTITLLIGKGGQIADVISPSDANQVLYGYVLETGSKEFIKGDGNSYTSNFIRVALPDGNDYEYMTKSAYSSYLNATVNISFQDGVASVSAVKSDGNLSGAVHSSSRTIGNTNVADDAQIIDVSTTDKYTQANFVPVFLQRLDGVKLSASDILYYQKNEKNEISALILNDVTGDTYQYGVVTSASSRSSGMNVSGSYTYDIGGVTQSVSTNGSTYSIYTGQPAQFFISGGKVQSMKPLQQLERSLKKITSTTVTTDNGDSYQLASDAVIYRKTSDFQYLKIPLEEVMDQDQYKVSAYYDKSLQGGGRIRVLLAEKK